jgi:hypothetical protein
MLLLLEFAGRVRWIAAVCRQRSIRAKAKLGHERAAGPSVVAPLNAADEWL